MKRIRTLLHKLRPQRISSDPILEADILYRREKARNDLLESELNEYKGFFKTLKRLMDKE